MSSVIALSLILVVVVGTYACGDALLHRSTLAKGSEPMEFALFSTALGLGFLGLALFAFGVTVGTDVSAVQALPFGLVILFFLGRIRGARQRRTLPDMRSLNPLEWACVVALGVAAVATLIGALAPPVGLEWDALSYHLAAPKIWLREGRITHIPFIHQSNFPFLLQMLNVWMLSLGSTAGAKLCHWLCSALLIVSIVPFATRHIRPHGRAVGLVAAVIVAITPIVFWEATVAYVDNATALFTWLSLYALFNAFQKRESDDADIDTTKPRRAWLILSAVLMGFALGTKYTVLGFWGMVGLGMVGVGVLQNGRKLTKETIANTAIWGVVSLMVGSPWYIKNIIFTGNPVFPFFYGIFGGKYWNAENALLYAADQNKFGIGKTPLDLLLSPWTVTMPTTSPYFTEYGFALTPVLVALVLAAPFLAPRLSNTARVLALFAGGVFAFWFLIMQQTRYLIPALPALALIGAEAMVVAYHERRRIAAFAGAAVVVASAIFGLVTGITGITVPASRVVFGQQSEDEYIRRRLPGLGAAIQHINESAPKDAKVALLDETRAFYLDREYVWATPNHAANYLPWESYTDARAWRDDFVRRGFTYLLVPMGDDAATNPPKDGQRWRDLLPEAVRDGLLEETFAAHGPNTTVRVFRFL